MATPRMFVPMAVLLMSAVAACAPAEPDAGAPDGALVPPANSQAGPAVGYRAGGNEPFWTLTIGQATMEFADMGGDTKASAPRVPLTALADGWRFSATSGGRPFVVDIKNEKCSDSMSGMPFPHTVTVVVNGRTYDGCGGQTADLLTAGEWRVVQLEGAAASAVRQPTLTFAADGSLTGTGGCNRYRSTWQLTGESIDLGPAMATEMACAENDLSAQETRFFSLLDQVTRFDVGNDGSLILYAMDRPVITARPVVP